MKLVRTDSTDKDFLSLVARLDADLAERNGETNVFFAQYNKSNHLRHVVVVYLDGLAVGCGAIKEFEPGSMEIKRMYVLPSHRGKGLAGAVLQELERWATELGNNSCVLETGDKMPEAIRLYTKSGYERIPNYGPYAGVSSSYCFRKLISIQS